ncbi:MAG TPA: CooT family nickel-binding protein [Anaerolineae bacterium]|nr:CooT family nickel-binding protein [Anaerolineae bacterium]
MCQATVYLGEKKVAEEVTGLEPVEDGVRIAAFFEEPRLVPGRILRIDFLKHRVWLEPLGEERETAR